MSTFVNGESGNVSGADLVTAINSADPGEIGADVLTATATYNPPSLTDGTMDTIQSITVTGAAVGNRVAVSFTVDLAGVALRAWVSGTNTVKYVFHNNTGGTVDLASGTVKVWVFQ